MSDFSSEKTSELHMYREECLKPSIKAFFRSFRQYQMDTNIYRRTSNRTQLYVSNSDLSALYFDLEAMLVQTNAEKDGRNIVTG
jgi:hypothetical protein